MFNKKILHTSRAYENLDRNYNKPVNNVYWATVTSIDDPTGGGRIKGRINALDGDIKKDNDDNLVYMNPLIPKFFHVYPKVGEVVRVLIEDINAPQKNRFWVGSVISQLPRLKKDPQITALSTSNDNVSSADTSIDEIIESKGVYPDKEDIAILGRVNTDLIFRENDVELRSGKHEDGKVSVLNNKNPASVRLVFDKEEDGSLTSNNVLMADRIALISHDGSPKFKASQLTKEDRDKIFETAHPLGRGDVIVTALELLKKAILEHIHPFATLPVDKSGIITDLEKVDFTKILQKNIVIN